MTTRALSTFRKSTSKLRGRKYQKFLISIPLKVVEDSSFPFHAGEAVCVRIDGDRLIIEKK
ncbi:MAG TPA: hypothetical protein VMV49_18010 [Candidatus Deferrimicrobium sp.]|nr:hypothetical protein [Candidatus Deferrimicrobium sp.]